MYENVRRSTRCVRYAATFVLATAVFFLGAGQFAVAQTATGPYAAITGVISGQPDDLIGNAAFGGQIGYRTPTGFLLLGEYLYAGKDYYFYEDSSWKLAASWPDVPSGSTSRSDWIFYRERHAVGIAAGFSGAVHRVGLFGAGGLMFNIVTLSEGADYYPDFEKAATQSSIGDSTVLFTTTLRGGIVYPARSPVAGHLALMMQLEASDQLDDSRYYRRNTFILLGMSFQLGPLLTGGVQ
jgi:hypothetical protein